MSQSSFFTKFFNFICYKLFIDIIAHICARENPVCSVLKSYEGFSAGDGSKNLKQIIL